MIINSSHLTSNFNNFIYDKASKQAEDDEVYTLASESLVCTQDMSTQVDENELNSFISQEREAVTGYSSDGKHLTDRNIEQLNPESINDPNASQFYEEEKLGFIDKGLNTIAVSGYWTAVKIIHSVRTFFYQSEYELLLALCDPTQEVRVSQSWFFAKDREQLYGITKDLPAPAAERSFIKKWFYDYPHYFFIHLPKKYILDTSKMAYYEGTIFKRAPQYNALALLHTVPFVAGERIEKVTSNLQDHIETVFKQLEPVLARLDYQTDSTIEYLERRCQDALEVVFSKTCEFATSDVGANETLFKSIEKKFAELINQHFPSFDTYFNNRFKISTLKVNVEQSFSIGNLMAKKIRDMRDVFLEKFGVLKDTRENKIIKLKAYHEILNQIYELIADKQDLLKASLENYRKFIQNT